MKKIINNFTDYEIDSLGIVISNKTKISKNLITVIDKKGYLSVRLCNKNSIQRKSIHRLVAESFIANPLNKPCVNHIDGNKLNNCVENLEWVTVKENYDHAVSIGLINTKGSNNHMSKKVINVKTKKIYETLISAAKDNNINPVSLCRYLTGKRKNITDLIYLT